MLQLNQCLSNPIKYKDGREYIPNKVYFATPFLVNTRVIREQFEAIKNLDGKLSVIDGAMIYEQIKKLAPEIIDNFVVSPADKISSSVRELQNIELLKAIRASEDPIRENFYSDLDFFVGKADSNTVLNRSIKASEKRYVLSKDKWIKVKKHVFSLCDKNMISPHFSVIENEYKDWGERYRSKGNIEVLKRIIEIDYEIDELKKSLVEIIEDQKIKIDTKISKSADGLKKGMYEELQDVRSSLDYVVSDLNKLDSVLIENIRNDFEAMRSRGYVNKKGVDNAESILNSLNALLEEKNKKNAKAVSSPEYIFKVVPQSVESWWDGIGKWYIDSVEKMNSGSLDHDEIKVFLSDIRHILSVVNSMIFLGEDIGSFFVLTNKEKIEDRISLSIQDVFNTGINAALYGEAGAGKTTTLQVYSKNEIEKNDDSKNVYYFPLNRILSAKIELGRDDFDKLKAFEKFFLYLLVYRGVDNTPYELGRTISAVSSGAKSVFIFDGIDEAIKVAPWIINAINQISKEFLNCQVIVSSRDCVKYIDEIDFVGLTLLPFNERQLERFINGWIADERKALKVIEDLKEREIIHVIKNPLLATIICNLHNKGVDIPRSEIEIYRKRIRLLSGMYDNFKDVVRTKNTQDDIEDAAKKIAFVLHDRQVRQASRSDIINILVSSSYGKKSRANCEELFSELVDPCNILKKVPLEDAYSFGHLRFQEHLAAEEIMRRRDFDIVNATRFDWWSGVLYLYASENPIDGLVDDIYKRYGSLSDSEVCLKKMVSAKGKVERLSLGVLIDGLIKQDSYVLDATYDYDSDDDSKEFLNDYFP